MKVLDQELDKKPKTSSVKEMAELRIRNLLCFKELQSLNDKGKFLYQHPLISCMSEREELKKLLRNNPTEFLHRYKSASNNLRRYKGYVKKKRPKLYNEDKAHFKYYQALVDVFNNIIQEKNGN